MRARIELLPESVINQIAAGEVVERPASVVKELVENSLDAGAQHVEVECEAGGTRLIRVRDDGSGIPRDELRLALNRHATSKLRTLLDLSALATLGFRGEALPSIGSVARVTVTSNVEASDNAWSVSMHGDADIDGPQPAAHTHGTTVEVRELFFNVPARRRFLKSERTEFLHIHDWLRRAALATPQVGLRLVHNGQRLLTVQPAHTDAQLTARMEKICGATFARKAIAVQSSSGELRLRGWIAPAEAARNQSNLQFWFVNGRPVRDPRLQHATRLAFEGTLDPGRYPAYALYLEIDPAEVDVNAHPAKTEVRFVDSRRVHDFVFSALRRSLHAPQAAIADDAAGSRTPVLGPVRVAERKLAYAGDVPVSAGVATAGGPTTKSGPDWTGQVATVLYGGLVVTTVDGAVILLDVVQARTALYTRMLMAQASRGAVDSQPLMFPQILETANHTIDVAAGIRAPLLECGFDVEPAGPATLMVRAIPLLLRAAPAAAVATAAIDTVTSLASEGVTDPALLRHRILNRAAEAAARALAPQRPAEAQVLLQELELEFGYEELAYLGAARRLDEPSLRALLQQRG